MDQEIGSGPYKGAQRIHFDALLRTIRLHSIQMFSPEKSRVSLSR